MNKIVTWYSYRHVWWGNGWWCECRYVFPSCSPWRVSLRSPLSPCIPLWISVSRREIWNPLVTSLRLVKLLKNVLSYLRSFSIKVLSWPFFFFLHFVTPRGKVWRRRSFPFILFWGQWGVLLGEVGCGSEGRAQGSAGHRESPCFFPAPSLLSPPLPSLPSLSKAL